MPGLNQDYNILVKHLQGLISDKFSKLPLWEFALDPYKAC